MELSAVPQNKPMILLILVHFIISSILFFIFSFWNKLLSCTLVRVKLMMALPQPASMCQHICAHCHSQCFSALPARARHFTFLVKLWTFPVLHIVKLKSEELSFLFKSYSQRAAKLEGNPGGFDPIRSGMPRPSDTVTDWANLFPKQHCFCQWSTSVAVQKPLRSSGSHGSTVSRY